jgi:hypothetical protein
MMMDHLQTFQKRLPFLMTRDKDERISDDKNTQLLVGPSASRPYGKFG